MTRLPWLYYAGATFLSVVYSFVDVDNLLSYFNAELVGSATTKSVMAANVGHVPKKQKAIHSGTKVDIIRDMLRGTKASTVNIDTF